MKVIRVTSEIITLVFLLVTVTSCVVSNISETHMRAPTYGFTAEIDEPSARGQLSRVSPEQSDVFYRFDISPDGNYIIYSGMQSGGGDKLIQLWKIATDGSGSPTKITSGGDKSFYYPSFTNDGQYIVYASANQIWRVRSDGAGGKMLIPGTGSKADTAPHLSIDNKLVFTSYQYVTTGNNVTRKYLIWTSNLDGGELTQIREGSNPRWSPDGNKIVFEHDGEIWTINADGTSLIQLTNTSEISEQLPSFSPDGTMIVYTSNEGKDGKRSTDWNIWTMSSDGSERMQITELDSWDSWPIWGSNGIYFLSARAKSGRQNLQRIWKLKN